MQLSERSKRNDAKKRKCQWYNRIRSLMKLRLEGKLNCRRRKIHTSRRNPKIYATEWKEREGECMIMYYERKERHFRWEGRNACRSREICTVHSQELFQILKLVKGNERLAFFESLLLPGPAAPAASGRAGRRRRGGRPVGVTGRRRQRPVGAGVNMVDLRFSQLNLSKFHKFSNYP